MPDSNTASGVCNICGCAEFEPGFRGRSPRGMLPQCTGCKSSERHRAARRVYEALRPVSDRWRVLHFAPDRSVDPTQFATYRKSSFGHATSLDMMATGLPDASFDVVISNHVLEHLPDFLRGVRETLRLVGESGFVHAMVPASSWDLDDWGMADPTKNHHYREFGANFALSVQQAISGVYAMGIAAGDPVTGAVDVIYLFSRSPETLMGVHRVLARNGVAIIRFF